MRPSVPISKFPISNFPYCHQFLHKQRRTIHPLHLISSKPPDRNWFPQRRDQKEPKNHAHSRPYNLLGATMFRSIADTCPMSGFAAAEDESACRVYYFRIIANHRLPSQCRSSGGRLRNRHGTATLPRAITMAAFMKRDHFVRVLFICPIQYSLSRTYFKCRVKGFRTTVPTPRFHRRHGRGRNREYCSCRE